MHFDGIDDRNAAERISKTDLYGEPIEDQSVMWVHELIGPKSLMSLAPVMASAFRLLITRLIRCLNSSRGTGASCVYHRAIERQNYD
ncbi:hypothetical protein EMGBS4_14750 [Acidimicrobiaceae bacterium]|nr:hypothetical protein EMGBS4_14750 [Acidimicrobiaceae bacterium]